MNKRIIKKRNTRLTYGHKIKKRITKKIYVKPENMPNWVWIFWWTDGCLAHNGLDKDEAIWYIENGCFRGCCDFIITDLDLKVIAEVGEGPTIEISRDLKYGYVGNGYRIISLKTKRACDYGSNPDDPDEYNFRFLENIHVYYTDNNGNLQLGLLPKDYTYFDEGVDVLKKAEENFNEYYAGQGQFIKAVECQKDSSKTIYGILYINECNERILTYIQSETEEEAVKLFRMYYSGQNDNKIIEVTPVKYDVW